MLALLTSQFTQVDDDSALELLFPPILSKHECNPHADAKTL